MDPIPAWMRSLWDVWDVRILILFSLILQIILFIFGNRRKYNPSIWLQIIVWFAYLAADWVATVALAKLSNALIDSKKNALGVIWAPMLLLHLGGPDTITAYSIEDNQLWLRHFLGLVVQLAVAIYVLLMSWKVSRFSFLAFPMFVAGIIKYGERTWVLKSACDEEAQQVPFGSKEDEQPQHILTEQKDEEHLGHSPTEKEVISTEQEDDEQPQHILTKQKDEQHLGNSPTEKEVISTEQEDDEQPQHILTEQKDEQHLGNSPTEKEVISTKQEDEQIQRQKKEHIPTEQEDEKPQHVVPPDDIPKEVLVLAHQFFDLHKPHIANYVISKRSALVKNNSLVNQVKQDIFKYSKTIEVEMGLMYDLLYTKAPITYSKVGCILHSISFFCTVSVFMGFFLMIFLDEKWHQHYSIVDIAITVVLLVGAFMLEMYGITVILSSDWTMLWLSKHQKYEVVAQFFQKLPWLFSMNKRRRWSNLMGQFDLLSFSLNDKPTKLRRILGLFGIKEELENSMYKTYVDVPESLKEKILKFVLHRRSLGIELDNERIIVWHIATEVCYHQDSAIDSSDKETCKLLSHYLMYILIMHPFMLPVTTDVMFRHVTTSLKKKIEGKRGSGMEEAQLYHNLLEDFKLDDGIIIARAHYCIKLLLPMTNAKWRVLSSVWVRMIINAALKSQQNYHLQQLGRGGIINETKGFLYEETDSVSDFDLDFDTLV
ncbi:hypothetical protein F0562_030424 [Nyssa sinensis]|uniref:DUF4220 domain-containing protein n=1 Tax=Nyssa sinensis TaxID=561372 RepID=A0A5J5AWD8_9ASTE|nr:hypothetical protein F0562_030424 [Nyssa sinensis]